MYIATIVKSPNPLTKTLGCDSPHNPKKCLMKCINGSNIIYQTDDLRNLFVSDVQFLKLLSFQLHGPLESRPYFSV
mgnify:CR=1 FL=1|jgi:hypothetical protein